MRLARRADRAYYSGVKLSVLAALVALSSSVAAQRRAPARPSPAAAAPGSVVVDGARSIRLGALQLKALGIRPAANGMVAVEFPVSVLNPIPARIPGVPQRNQPQDPPRVWTTLRADGSLLLVRTRLVPGNEEVPGPPGTRYQVSVKDGVILLRHAPQAPPSARPQRPEAPRRGRG
jgi:hypothetical protein